ncbi:MAG: M20 family metallo-hydrolase [Pseudomonadota bacterium]
MPTLVNTLLSYLSNTDTIRERILELQTAMTALPALGPENFPEGTLCAGERPKANYLLGELKRMGFTDIESIDAPDARTEDGTRPNIAAKIAGKSGRTLWLIGHMDVVATGDLEYWNTDPWTVHVDENNDDIIYGRGVEDNQQGIVSGLLAAEALLASGQTPEIGLGLLFVADEETGNLFGIDHIMKVRSDLFAKDDIIVVPDCGNYAGTMLEVAEKGILWLKVQVTGKQCHASTPDKGINSLEAASAMIVRVRELYDVFPEQNPIFSPPTSTFSATKKEANVSSVNIIPGSDVFYIDCRILPCYNLDAVRAAAQSIADQVAAAYNVTIELTDVQTEPAAPATPVDSDVVTKLSAAITSVTGETAIPMGIGGGTVAAFLRHRGLQAAVWGKLIPNAHTPNEHSRISATVDEAKVFVSMLG